MLSKSSYRIPIIMKTGPEMKLFDEIIEIFEIIEMTEIIQLTENNWLKLIEIINDTINFDQASCAFNFQKRLEYYQVFN